MLCTDRKTDSIWLNTLIQKLCLVALGMCGRCRMDCQRLHICYVGKQREQLKLINEILCLLCITLDLKRKDRTAAIWEILLVKLLLLRIL